MSLTVEDGTVVAGADSYVDAAYADSYHTKRNNTTWTAETSVTAREAALRKATQYVDAHYRRRFVGSRADDDQELEWPRIGATDTDGIILDNMIPIQLKHAVCELAVRSLSSDLMGDEDRGGRVKRVKVGEIETEYEGSAPSGTVYRMVDAIIGRLLRTGRGSVRVQRT